MKIEKRRYKEELQEEFIIKKEGKQYVLYEYHVLKSDPRVKSKTKKYFASKQQSIHLDILGKDFPDFKQQVNSPKGYKSIIP